ncbi:hypothetical protein BGX38DRAFT_261861 [Terfezia claveryi]|nr:hypothetical protein BGX38DRAFT_261861 [Terfezia claveryi]
MQCPQMQLRSHATPYMLPQADTPLTISTCLTRGNYSSSGAHKDASNISTTTSIPPATLTKAVLGGKRKRAGEHKQTRIKSGAVGRQEQEVEGVKGVEVEKGMELHGLGNFEDRLEEPVNVEKRVEDQLEDHLKEHNGNDLGSSGKEAEDPPDTVLYARQFLNHLAPLIQQPTQFPLHMVHKRRGNPTQFRPHLTMHVRDLWRDLIL